MIPNENRERLVKKTQEGKESVIKERMRSSKEFIQ